MAFIDDLALVEVLLAAVAALFFYSGILMWWNIRENNPNGVRSVLRGVAPAVGIVGVTTLGIALWGEFTWPFPAAFKMAGYNIFFFDPMVLMGIVLVAYAAAAYFELKMQYVGVLAVVAGVATAFYGWTGWTASPAFTKEPFDTFLLYSAFASVGVFTFPTTVIVDYFLKVSDLGGVPFAWGLKLPEPSRGGSRLGTRGVQPVTPGAADVASKAETSDATPKYHCPIWVQSLVLLLPLFAFLAGVAAFWYFSTTLPGHLGAGPGAAP